MRKLKTISTQDHLIHVIEVTSGNTDLACGLSESKVQLDEIMTVFYAEGSLNHFTKENLSDNWTLRGNTSSPLWAFSKPGDWFRGAVSTEPMVMITFIPKINDYSSPELNYLNDVDVENIDRESYLELGTANMQKQMNPNTYEELDDVLDDEVSDEVVFE